MIIALLLFPAALLVAQTSEPGFVSIRDLAPTIQVDARYFGSHNFVGEPIRGYDAPKCLLSIDAAAALARVQEDLRPFGLGLKTYDCYRPQRAVNHFVAWAANVADTRRKAEFYPAVAKSTLFADGYIADRSGHSRGSTVDLTIVPLGTSAELVSLDLPSDCRLPTGRRQHDNSIEMGTAYDCFDPLSHTANASVSAETRRSRALLKAAMERRGFSNYPQEWWHFTLTIEPYPNQYFDLPVD